MIILLKFGIFMLGFAFGIVTTIYFTHKKIEVISYARGYLDGKNGLNDIKYEIYRRYLSGSL